MVNLPVFQGVATATCYQASRLLRSGLLAESSMNGTARPYENSTADIANTATEFIF